MNKSLKRERPLWKRVGKEKCPTYRAKKMKQNRFFKRNAYFLNDFSTMRQFRVSTQLLQPLSGLVQKTINTKNDTKETMNPDSKKQ